MTDTAALGHRPTHPTIATGPDHRLPTAPTRTGAPAAATAQPVPPGPCTAGPAMPPATTLRHRPTHPTTPTDPDRVRPTTPARPVGVGPAPEERS